MAGERRAVAVLGVAMVGVLLMMAVAVLDIGAVISARNRSQTAAAALAAAPATFSLASPPREAAVRLAEANGARLVWCRCRVDRRPAPRIVAVRTGRRPSVALGGGHRLRPVPRRVHSLSCERMSPRRTGVTRATVFLQRTETSFRLHSYRVDFDAVADYGRAVAEQLGVDPARLFKTLVVFADDRPMVGLVSADARLSVKKLAKVTGVRRVRMASPLEAERLTGYVPGGISPFG